MHLSVFMGPVALGESKDKPMIDLCIDQAIACADAGFAMVTFGEQHFNNYEPYANPFLMGARLAPHLGKTWFGTTIVPLVLHHPLRLAEDSNVIDLLTQGRFILGMSAGRVGFSPDFENFGLDPARRDEIFESKLDYLTRAQRQKFDDAPIVMDSEWDHGRLLGRMMPVSWRRGGAQKAIGTNTDEKIDGIAARGWPVFLGPCLPEVAAAKLARHRAAMAAAGIDEAQQRDAARKSLVTRHVFCGATEERAWEIAESLAGMNPMMDRSTDPRSLRDLAHADLAAEENPRNAKHVQEWMAGGTPEQLIEQLRAYAASGVEHLNIRFTAGTADPAMVAESFDLFVREVLPNVDHELFPPLTDDEIEPVHLGAGR
jgi:alkanesulfonate monooxygenase SsuD/methylene tetrahydromethanopterin reductase-like flavin-dependent oxidoreductase (luciferase family)